MVRATPIVDSKAEFASQRNTALEGLREAEALRQGIRDNCPTLERWARLVAQAADRQSSN